MSCVKDVNGKIVNANAVVDQKLFFLIMVSECKCKNVNANSVVDQELFSKNVDNEP